MSLLPRDVVSAGDRTESRAARQDRAAADVARAGRASHDASEFRACFNQQAEEFCPDVPQLLVTLVPPISVANAPSDTRNAAAKCVVNGALGEKLVGRGAYARPLGLDASDQKRMFRDEA